MNLQVIHKAVLSEKAYANMEQGIYTFVVGKSANKKDVKKAIENQFSTKVVNIRFTAFPAKEKRVTGTRKTTYVGGGKKAIVVLEKGQKIALLSTKAETKGQRDKVKKVDKGTSNPDKKTDENQKDEKSGGLLSKLRKGKEAK